MSERAAMNTPSRGAGTDPAGSLADGWRLFTTAEVAEQLAMSEEWVRDHAGELGAIRAGGPRAPLRFEQEAINEWKAAHRVAAPEVRITRQARPHPATPPGVELLPMPPKTLLTARR